MYVHFACISSGGKDPQNAPMRPDAILSRLHITCNLWHAHAHMHGMHGCINAWVYYTEKTLIGRAFISVRS